MSADMNWLTTTAAVIVAAVSLVDMVQGKCTSLDPYCSTGQFKSDPDDCNLFCHCSHNNWVQKKCPKGLLFDETHMICNWANEVEGCEPIKGLCDSNPCRNGGTCMLSRGSYTCSCPPGFGGVDCLLRRDACASSPCQNGGRCRVTRDNMAACDCPPNTAGEFCQGRDACASSPCRNGGRCRVRSDNTAECDCPPNTAGEFCQDTTCPRYSCPQNVTSYNYPDWQDRTCRSFFSCQLGVLENRECSGNSVFSFVRLQCVQPAQLEFPCTLNFVDSQFS